MNKAIKTKNQISKALIELLNNKPLDLITIKELAKKAEISRTAFYNNLLFLSKKEIMSRICSSL